jgi:hypothetical protein
MVLQITGKHWEVSYMASIVINGEKLKLPGNLADRFKGRKIELIETEDGIFIRPIKSDPIKELKGFLRKGYS